MVNLMNIYSWSAVVLYDILIICSHGFKYISFYNHQLFEIRKSLHRSTEICGVGYQFHLYAVSDFLKIYYNRNRTKCSIAVFALMSVTEHKRVLEIVSHVQLVSSLLFMPFPIKNFSILFTQNNLP